MPVIFTRQPSERTRELRKEFKHNKVAQQFLTYLYQNGYLTRLEGRFNPQKLLKGKLPKDFDIHHICPLSGGGTNALTNLCLIEKSFHKFLNRRCFDPALKYIQEGETVEIDIPDLPPVALYRDFLPFIQKILAKTNRSSHFKRLLLYPLKRLPLFNEWKK